MNSERVLILGASGIIGQHMRLCVPPGIEPLWHRKTGDRLHSGCDMRNEKELRLFLDRFDPAVIVNLAGVNVTDRAEGNEAVNVDAVRTLAGWCSDHARHLIQISSQAVFSGEHPPYGPLSDLDPVNEYGMQKAQAEVLAARTPQYTILRPTFILGVRPMPLVGRANPAEQMLSGTQPRQVADRWFSTLFAGEAAYLIWKAVQRKTIGIAHLGNPARMSRFDVAQALGVECEPCSHDDFPGLEQRPLDTTYGGDTAYIRVFADGAEELKVQWRSLKNLSALARARELALFLGITEREAKVGIFKGFSHWHGNVAADFHRANPQTDDDLLRWYRETSAYLWELSCYHCDPGFNYSGVCEGVSERLKSIGVRSVLCLGDGIGDLTLHLARAGFDAVYNDLKGSKTADFADFRFWLHHPAPIRKMLTDSWEPRIEGRYDAVISLDFLEHVTDVAAWTEAIRQALNPGGWFLAQNAFGMGSGRRGSIPCHLARNDRYEKDWVPLLHELRFEQEGHSNWWRA